MHALKYRSDIDGLRALAVVPVILYHMGSALAPGGYVGVDVFFVISGYLITTVIRTEIDAGEFSILRFYERRARRILPALFATVLLTWLIALWVFMPDELRDMGASMVGVAAFASNILFWQQTDYFSGPVELKPLIHTWSLAVEEQYYILFPLFLMALARWGRRRYFWPTIVVAFVSFAISLAMLRLDPSGNYYLLPSRAWELLVGSLLAYGSLELRNRNWAEVLAAGGLVAILASVVLLDHDSPFPGYNALWPCLGAGAIIAAGSRGPTFVGRLLGWKPMVAIGLISYSLYLVHWPVIVFTRYVLLDMPGPLGQVAMIVAMVALAILSWRFVERPFRNRHRYSQRAILTIAAVGLVATGAAGAATFALRGLPQRFGKLEALGVRNEDADEARLPRCFLKGRSWTDWAGDACFLTGGDGPVTLFWGDSHANHYRRALAAVAPPPKTRILYYATAGCLPLLDEPQFRAECLPNARHVAEIIRRYKVRTVVLSGYWYFTMAHAGLSPEDVARTVATLRRMGVRVRIVGDNPDFPINNMQFLAYRLSRRSDPAQDFRMVPRNDRSVNPALRRIVGDADFFDPMNTLCRGRECLIYAEGHLLMNDNAHLSRFGSAMVVRDMRGFLNAAAAENR